MPKEFGADWATIQSRLPPRLYDCTPDWEWHLAAMPDFDLWCVWRGRGELVINTCTFELKAGSCFLLQPGDRIDGRGAPDDPLLVLSRHFWPCTAEGTLHRDRSLHPALMAEVTDVPFWRQQSTLAVEAWFESNQVRPLAEAILWHLIQLILVGNRWSREPDAALRLREVVAEIRRRPGEEWSVEALAKRCGWSRAQLTRQFKELTGLAPTAFVIQQRMVMANYLLCETPLPIGRIAEMLGYRDPYFFSRQFKAHHGMSPQVYRRQGNPMGAMDARLAEGRAQD